MVMAIQTLINNKREVSLVTLVIVGHNHSVKYEAVTFVGPMSAVTTPERQGYYIGEMHSTKMQKMGS